MRTWRRRSTEVGQHLLRRIIATHAVDACAGVSVTGAEIQPFDRHAVAKVRKHRPKKELAVPSARSPAKIASDEVGVHCLEPIRRHHATGEDARPKARSQTLDPCVDAVAKLLLRLGPANVELRGYVRISPECMAAWGGPSRVDETLLPDDEIGMIG